MKIFLTGATGFIGGALLRRLLDQAEKIHLLVRPQSELSVRHPKIEIFNGNLGDLTVLRAGMRGCDAVFHVAAWVRLASEDRPLFDRTNIEGTRFVLEAASAERVGKVVYTSSVVAIGPSGEGGVADEKTARNHPFLTEYERTKALAEEGVIQAARNGFPAVVVSPSLVFGPTDSLKRRSFNRFLLESAAGRVLFIPGSGEQKINPVYIDDVVQGHLLALEKGKAGERYILGGENITINELAQTMSDLLKNKPRRVYIPIPLLRGLGFIETGLSRLQGREPRMTRQLAAVYRHDWAYSSEKAEVELGYRPLPLKEGLKRTLEWAFTDQGRVWKLLQK